MEQYSENYWLLLQAIVYLPLVGALLMIFFVKKENARAIKACTILIMRW